MLRPERMSKVSVTGARPVMDDVVEAIHELHLVHLSDYDGSWEGFAPGDPVEGADEAAEKLVTVRSLQSVLGVDPDDADADRVVVEDLDGELARVRAAANNLDDRRDELQSEARDLAEAIDAMDPFMELGIDLDLLSGYETLAVAVGYAEADDLARSVETTDAVAEYDVWRAEDSAAVAVFVHPVDGVDPEAALEEGLVGVQFDRVGIPEDDGSPVERKTRLQDRLETVESKLDDVEAEIEELREEAADFLLAAEERLRIEVQRAEAPLHFATTENSFVAEGWVPTDRYDDLVGALEAAVGDHVEIEELERAEYSEDGVPEEREPVEPGAGPESGVGDPQPTPAADGGTGGADPAGTETGTDGGRARTDGGVGTAGGGAGAGTGVVTMRDDPPTAFDNPGPAKPFEVLVEMVDIPRYDEFDPTALLLLTFPAFFGFMIGDLGYGILYTLLGAVLWTRFESDAVRSLGGVAIWAGGFTMLFGVLYGEFLGLHWLGELYGGPVIHKGLQPAEIQSAKAWIVVTAVVGVLHVTVGYTLNFLKELRHGVVDAVTEGGSWMLMMWGLWGWIFSKHLGSSKPEFIIGPESVFNAEPLPLGFTGLPEVVGIAGIGAFVLGLVLIAYADPVEAVEAAFLQVLVRGLSYTRIAAVLLAKAGMAFVVNLLVFGAYTEGEPAEFHFLFFSEKTAAKVMKGAETELIFAGLVNGSGAVELAVGWLAGVLVFLVGHAIVLGLGVTSAGLQAVRLEYVEFFTEFYDGGGDRYEPFGTERRYTAED